MRTNLRLPRLGKVTTSVCALVLVLASASGLLLSRREAAAQGSRIRLGQALYTGTLPISARMVGHDANLPAQASRCSNCHPVDRRHDASTVISTPQERFAPLLTRATLTEGKPRRGGPPSSYDVTAFCRLLSSGVDPAFVMIPQTMPRYRLSTEECHALWAYVTSL